MVKEVSPDLYPFAGKYFEQEPGVRMHYLDEGSGHPVLMVHGNPTWSFYYRDLVRELSTTHRTIVPDHVGCGRSDQPGRYPYTLERRVRDLERLVDHLEPDRPITLIVHDWGGMIGLAWATRHAKRIERLVVLNTAAFRLPAGTSFPRELMLARTPLLGSLLVRGLNLFVRGSVRRCVTRRPLTPEVAQGYLAPYDSWAARVAVHEFVRDIPLAPGDPSWGELVRTEEELPLLREKPMTIFWGMRDFVFGEGFLNAWIERFPTARVHRYQDAGHFVLEDAGEEIRPLVRAFLDEPVG